MPVLIDGHLDLAFNALNKGRDLSQPLDDLRRLEQRSSETALVTLPELRQAGISVVFATTFTYPSRPGKNFEGAYSSAKEAQQQGLAQLELYERWEDAGLIRILRTRANLETQLQENPNDKTGVVLLMENADPIIKPEDLESWARRGLRIVGPAWRATRYAGGTHEPGPLSELGVELVQAINELKLTLDSSHLAEESFWQALQLNPQHLIASHSNARKFVASDRQLSDDMIKAIATRGGIIGLVLGSPFLKAKGDPFKTKSPGHSSLADVRKHAKHIAGLSSWQHLAIGSDFDGGFGVEETPLEITRGADFAKLGEAVPEKAKAGFLGENWLRFLRQALP